MENRQTLVLGVSLKPDRYSYKAVQMLCDHNFPVIAVGLVEGFIKNIPVQKNIPFNTPIHTITLYMNAERQKEIEHEIISLKPVRIIFNPGAENDNLFKLAQQSNIQVINACTLVLLTTYQYF
ncbi:MAG: CoA-binding protein [Sediminibacterium sp.]|nr:CoA-binding protein [Sediminibacterium sp.]